MAYRYSSKWLVNLTLILLAVYHVEASDSGGRSQDGLSSVLEERNLAASCKKACRRKKTAKKLEKCRRKKCPASTGTYEQLERFPHDSSSFTQGLALQDGVLYEGSGLYGKSEVKIVSLSTGVASKSHQLASRYFGEGITYYLDNRQGRLIQITWLEKTGFIYTDNLELLREFTYSTSTGEGWGIAYKKNTHEFLVSDGSHYIMIWDADTLEEKTDKRLAVTLMSQSGSRRNLDQLNELEFDTFSNTLLANVWKQDYIVRIDLNSGNVMTIYDLTDIVPSRTTGANVLNGIALTEEANVFLVTGKLWPSLYRIRLID
jgi:glutamine cyclotransferase